MALFKMGNRKPALPIRQAKRVSDGGSHAMLVPALGSPTTTGYNGRAVGNDPFSCYATEFET
jgi:hypothetical protein